MSRIFFLNPAKSVPISPAMPRREIISPSSLQAGTIQLNTPNPAPRRSDRRRCDWWRKRFWWRKCDQTIKPPQPLFDTSALDPTGGGSDPIDGTPMRSTSGFDEKGDIDDPVSGGGNPALMDVPPTPPTANQEKQP